MGRILVLREVAILLLLLFSFHETKAADCAGGAGYSAFFDNGNEGDKANDMRLVGSLNSFPISQFSLEFWTKTTALAKFSGFLLSYLSPDLSSAQLAVTDYDGVVVQIMGVDALTGIRGVGDGSWHHLAFTYSSSKQLKVYKDGSQAFATTMTTAAAFSLAAGKLVLGEDPLFDNTGVVDSYGHIDELRIWNTARTGSEIADNRYTGTLPSTSGLYLHLPFNSLSGGGSHFADVVSGYQFTLQANSRFKGVLTALPFRAPSSAPLHCAGHVVAAGSAGKAVVVRLGYNSTTSPPSTLSVQSLPANGATVSQTSDGVTAAAAAVSSVPATVSHSGGAVVVTPPASGFTQPVIFTYAVGATATATVEVVVNGVPSADGYHAIANEDTQASIFLPGTDPDGDDLYAIIATLPTAGALWQEDGTPITTAGTRVSHAQGFVKFIPAANAHGTPYASFTYSMSDGLASSAAGTVTIDVISINDEPVAVTMVFNGTEDHNVTGIVLSATDVDNAEQPLLLLASLPEKGQLLRHDGTPITRITDSRHKIRQYASAVVGCSSFYDNGDCPGACSWQCQQALGAPDVYPLFGDQEKAWAPLTAGSKEYITLDFPTAVYVSAVEIFETFNPGFTFRISAQKPDGSMDVIWEGWNKRAFGTLPYLNQVFKPLVCRTAYKTSRLRIDIDSASVVGWAEIDAVQLVGYADLPRAVLSDPRLTYVPDEHGNGDAYDSFAYQAQDCTSESPLATVTFHLAAVNDAPVITVPPAGPYPEDAAAALTLGCADVDGHALQMRVTQQPTLGTLSDGDGPIGVHSGALVPLSRQQAASFSFRYLPDPSHDFCVTPQDSLQVECTDGRHSSSATVGIPIAALRQCVDMTGPNMAVAVIVCLCLLLLLVGCAAVVKFSDHVVIKAASPLFLLLIAAGFAGCYLSVLVTILPHSDFTCMLEPWLFGMSYTLVISALNAKTYRIYKLFNNPNMRRMRITTRELLKMVFLCMVGMMIIMFLYTIFGYGCKNRAGATWGAISFGYKGLLVLWGSFLSFKTRNAPSEFSESKWTGWAVYNDLLTTCLVLPVLQLVTGNPQAQFLLKSCGVLFAITCSASLMFLPKFYIIATQGDIESKYVSGGTRGSGGRVHPQGGTQTSGGGLHTMQVPVVTYVGNGTAGSNAATPAAGGGAHHA